MVKKFYIYFFLISFSGIFPNPTFEKIPEDEILIVLKILKFGYERSSKTILFWENLILFLEEYKKSTENLISRIRNPSKLLDEELPLIKVDLNKIFLETKIAYDNYAKTINKYFEPGNLSIYSIEYINCARNSKKEFKEILFKSVVKDIFSFINERFNVKDLIFSKLFKNFFRKNDSIFDAYLQFDRILNDTFIKNCEININIYENYKKFWKFIEEKRKENLKNYYNSLIVYAKELFKEPFEEKIKSENLPLEIA